MKKIFSSWRQSTLLASALVLFMACSEGAKPVAKTTTEEKVKPEPKVERVAFEQPEWIENGLIYTINVRQFTEEGTLQSAENELPRIKKLGATILRVMPLQPIGKKNRQGTLGDYYSISNYNAINPDYGYPGDVKLFVAKAHELGMKVIMDWEANHTAFDHNFTVVRPDLYTNYFYGEWPIEAVNNKGKSLGRPDVADLNYTQEDTQGAMTEAMREWVIEYDFDGFYFVDAEYLPNDFFAYVAPQLKINKQDLFFASDFESAASLNALNSNAGNEFYNILRAVASGQQQAEEAFTTYLNKYKITRLPTDAPIYYTSGPRLNAFEKSASERFGTAQKACFLMAATFQSGMIEMYNGQEFESDKSLSFYDKDPLPQNQIADDFYRQVFALKARNVALHSGQYGGGTFVLSTDNAKNIFAFYRERYDNRVVVLVNFGDSPQEFTTFAPNIAGAYTNYFTQQSVELKAKTKLTLPAYGYLVLTR